MSLSKNRFLRELNIALAHLYDPDVLRRSPLVQLFNLANQASSTEKMRQALILRFPDKSEMA